MPPRSPESPPLAGGADFTACRQLLRTGSRSFYAASFLLPGVVREPASALYAFCRVSDDAADLETDGPAALERMRKRLAAVYAGTPRAQPIDRAFAATVERYAIPRALPEALFEGFDWDLAGRRYATLEDLRDYAARVAGTVGVMMSLIMGVRDPELLARAADLGIAMQLSNIARDVGEDARNGRIYLPLEWLADAGIDPEGFLRAPAAGPQLASVVRRLLDEAAATYASADPAIDRLPKACQPGIRAARLLYAEIGCEVDRTGLDSVSRRAVVPGWRKAALVAQAMSPMGAPGAQPATGPARAARFLVDAVLYAPNPSSSLRGDAAFAPPPWWNLNARVHRVIDLFERLERRELSRRRGRPAMSGRRSPEPIA
jgi:15-cis-phytoene synthase